MHIAIKIRNYNQAIKIAKVLKKTMRNFDEVRYLNIYIEDEMHVILYDNNNIIGIHNHSGVNTEKVYRSLSSYMDSQKPRKIKKWRKH